VQNSLKTWRSIPQRSLLNPEVNGRNKIEFDFVFLHVFAGSLATVATVGLLLLQKTRMAKLFFITIPYWVYNLRWYEAHINTDHEIRRLVILGHFPLAHDEKQPMG
jgi:hypothetical protein